jgi:hypothetical protein
MLKRSLGVAFVWVCFVGGIAMTMGRGILAVVGAGGGSGPIGRFLKQLNDQGDVSVGKVILVGISAIGAGILTLGILKRGPFRVAEATASQGRAAGAEPPAS